MNGTICPSCKYLNLQTTSICLNCQHQLEEDQLDEIPLENINPKIDTQQIA